MLYILLERWVAGTPAHGRDRGRASGRGRLSHAGTSRWPSSPQQPRWQCDNLLRQMVTEAGQPSDGGAGPLHQARDLSLWFSWREKTLHRQSFDEFPELSTGTRLSLLQLSKPILTLQLRASLDTACFKKNPNFVCWNTWHFPLSWWWNNQVFCGEHSHLICRNSIDFCSLLGEIWEDFVQVMLRALWRERFEIGSNLPTIILATECLLGFPAKFFPFHQDHKTRFELSRSKQLWKQRMLENKLMIWISSFGPILEAKGSDNIQCDGSAVSLDVHFQKWKWQAAHQLFSI